MIFLRNLFHPKTERIETYDDFWNWFNKKEKYFFKVVKQGKNIHKNFFNELSSKLNELKEGFFFLTGMYDDNTVELIITPDGNLKNLIFSEELIKSAPEIAGWKFTALKPSLDIKDVSIRMSNFEFNKDNLFFFANESKEYPDEIDITLIHNDYNEENKSIIINGTYIFLDNFLGELKSLTTIDFISFKNKNEVQKEIVPIAKLKDYLNWREKEFIEKYEGVLQNTENANYSILESELENGNKLLATINTDILNWDKKASHPWIVTIELIFGNEEFGGMPDEETYQKLNQIEEIILKELKDFEGYLNIGRQTANGIREIYFACKDFRKPSKVLYEFSKKNNETIKFEYEIYKDKYWKSFNRFRNNI